MTAPARALPALIATAAATAVFAGGCSATVPIGADPSVRYSETCFGPSGGQLSIADARIDVPRDAILSGEVCVELEHVGVETLPSGYVLLGQPVAVTATTSGVELRRPLTITLKFADSGVDAWVGRMDDDGSWFRVDDAAVERVIVSSTTANVQTFYDGVFAVLDIPDAECGSNADCTEFEERCNTSFVCVPVFCDDDADCIGGEVCFDEACVEPCDTNADCEDFDGLCLETGICSLGECQSDEDCNDEQFCYFEDDDDDEGEPGVCVSDDA